MRYTEKDRHHFTEPAEALAPWLLGKIICRELSDGFIVRCRINVTEAYIQGEPFNDAVRAEKSGEKTTQHKEGGHLYVKPARGEHRFDIVANIGGVGEGVLIRSVDPYKEGPFRAAWALDISSELDGADLLTSNKVWLEYDDAVITPNEPTTRVNLDSSKKLRFSISEIKFRGD